MSKNSGSGIWIQDEPLGSYYRKLKKQFFGLKYLINSLMRIRDGGWKKFESGILDGKNSDPG
jgi:hypothetical protein